MAQTITSLDDGFPITLDGNGNSQRIAIKVYALTYAMGISARLTFVLTNGSRFSLGIGASYRSDSILEIVQIINGVAGDVVTITSGDSSQIGGPSALLVQTGSGLVIPVTAYGASTYALQQNVLGVLPPQYPVFTGGAVNDPFWGTINLMHLVTVGGAHTYNHNYLQRLAVSWEDTEGNETTLVTVQLLRYSLVSGGASSNSGFFPFNPADDPNSYGAGLSIEAYSADATTATIVALLGTWQLPGAWPYTATASEETASNTLILDWSATDYPRQIHLAGGVSSTDLLGLRVLSSDSGAPINLTSQWDFAVTN